jgi:malonyl-CoA/methylmalonyl-CoA synthetase
MYDTNHLAHHLRSASVGRDNALYAEMLDSTKLTYGEMFSAAEKNASALQLAGLKPGDRVAAQVEKSIESIQLYLGTVLAGGVFLPLNTAYTVSELEYFLRDAQPLIFVCDPKKSDTLQVLADQTGVGKLFTLSVEGLGSLKDALPKHVVNFKEVARGKDDLAAFLYTSGTTGRSKGAMLTHNNLVSNAESLCECWHFDNTDVLIHALPLFHIHGLFVATNITFFAGSSMIFMPRFDSETIIAVMYRATVLMGVPTFYVRLLESANLCAQAVAHMRLFISGSAPLLAETHKQWQNVTDTAILERYGMTETNMNTSNPYKGERRAGTVGMPLPGVEVRIADADSGQQLAQGEIGSVEIRGPNVFKGYWQMPEKTKQEFRDDGFFITGDIGTIDGDNYLSIVGRSKDLIISGGYNVYPKEIEIILDDIEGVYESAVIGVPHPDFGEGVLAVVVLVAGQSLNESHLKTFLKHKLAPYKRPKNIFFVEELPRNTMGKVLKNTLRDQHKDNFIKHSG